MKKMWLLGLLARGSRALGVTTLLAAGAANVGCSEDVDSDDVATDAVYAGISVLAPGDGTSQVSTYLKVGGANSNTYLDLTDYDALIAYANTSSASMSQSGNSYHASFPFEAEDTPYRVSFIRSPPPDGECAGRSAPNSTVTLPAPFSLTAPVQDSSHSRAAPLSIQWSGSGEADAMSFSVDGPCIQAYSDNIENDNGSFTIPANSIMVVGSANAMCTATVSVYRSRDGVLDDNYGEGGVINATQRRGVQFTTTQ
jgi:hypothetical protein